MAQANRLERDRNQEAWIRSESDDEKHKLERMAVVRLREAPENASVAKATVSLAFARDHWGRKVDALCASPGLACLDTSAFLARKHVHVWSISQTSFRCYNSDVLRSLGRKVLIVLLPEGLCLYFHPWVRMLNVIFGFVTCLSETLNTLRFLC